MVGEGKLSQSEATEIGNRTDVLSYGLLAEINTFHTGRNHDIKEAHKHFLKEQISHYQKVKLLFYFRLRSIVLNDNQISDKVKLKCYLILHRLPKNYKMPCGCLTIAEYWI